MEVWGGGVSNVISIDSVLEEASRPPKQAAEDSVLRAFT